MSTSGRTSWRCAVGCVEKLGCRLIGFRVAQVDERDVELLAQRTRDIAFTDGTPLHEHRAEEPVALCPRGVFDGFAGRSARPDEQVPQARPRLEPKGVGYELGERTSYLYGRVAAFQRAPRAKLCVRSRISPRSVRIA